MNVSVVDSTTVCRNSDALSLLHSTTPSVVRHQSEFSGRTAARAKRGSPASMKQPLSRHLNANGSVMAMVEKMNMYTMGSAKRFHFTAPT